MEVTFESDPFPDPVFKRSTIRKLNVLMQDNTIQKRTSIDNGSGQFYEIGKQLKKAIFGQVVHAMELKYLGNDQFLRTGKELAIKVYSKKTLRQYAGKTQEDPLREISALQFIGDEHPNIMGQIECCTDEDNIYSIMRFCKGGELFDYIDEYGPMEETQARDMFHQLVDGLSRLSELGIGHRDLSLENVLYAPPDRTSATPTASLYVIIDFGMCIRLKLNPHFVPPSINAIPSAPGCGGRTPRFLSIVKQPICGKRNYISPEVLREDEVFNPMNSDLWALGVILFMVLTGVPPVDKATLADERYGLICEGKLAGECVKCFVCSYLLVIHCIKV